VNRIFSRESEHLFVVSHLQANIREMSFAENLKRLMRARGLTPRIVCQATGVPSSTLSEWTSGREPKLSEPILNVAKFFGVTLEELITGKPASPAETVLLHEFLGDFTEIHSGVYRIKIEKIKS
jgi:transcriptional regulator with XRE-family HTH domain